MTTLRRVFECGVIPLDQIVVRVDLGALAAETLLELFERGFDVSHDAERWRLPAPTRDTSN